VFIDLHRMDTNALARFQFIVSRPRCVLAVERSPHSSDDCSATPFICCGIDSFGDIEEKF
jgi:hypothetical protein